MRHVIALADLVKGCSKNFQRIQALVPMSAMTPFFWSGVTRGLTAVFHTSPPRTPHQQRIKAIAGTQNFLTTRSNVAQYQRGVQG